ncbi:MAG: metallophosphoesterase [Dysgonamonadaceae bacterium]|jgi:5'-nucleotidase|nr:metallophosphoesterase [Dysgonamonadaceae bacterium]
MQRLIIGLLFIISISLHAQDTKPFVILHNNDTHSRIEPLPDNAPGYGGRGGVVRQQAYVEEVRSENPNVLLFHSGDFVQGTPYFNLFKGQVEVACMNFMKYDAACLGNHEFDNGLDNLAEMVRAADFPIVATNLDFTGTPLEGLTRKYILLERQGLKIGVIGLTVSPDGLVAKYNYGNMKYSDPVQTANETAALLKNREACDLVICLSHLGYYADEKELGDITLARESENIDIILGGHTHTFLRFADRRLNKKGEEVVIDQVGDRGICMGRLDVVMEKIKEK